MNGHDQRRWDERHAAAERGTPEARAFLTRSAAELPTVGAALDVAGGSGRNALWLAARGLDVTLVDISPVGVAIASDRARRAGLELQFVVADLASEPLPRGPWALIVCTYYLHRPLYAAFAREIAPDGSVLCVQPTIRTLERQAKPSRRYLLELGELAELASAAGLEIVHVEEGWSNEDQHEARLLARRGS